MKKIIIALDGYSGTGKSSTARLVAKRLGYTYIDSGAMYRAVTFHFLVEDIDYTNLESVKKSLAHCEVTFENGQTCMNGVNVENKIRTMEVNAHVSPVSAIPMVRAKLVEQQRKMSRGKGVVMDGRDIGTVVFPEAELKLFLTADVNARAQRRQKELEAKGLDADLNRIKDNLKERDRMDSTREDSPLKKAPDAMEIDTSHLTLNQQVDKVVQLAEEIIYGN